MRAAAMKQLFAGMAVMLLMMMNVFGLLVMMADGSADPNVVLAFANGTKVSTSREDGSTQVQEPEIAWLPRGFAANTSWTPLGGSQFMQVFMGLTTTLNGANNEILSVDLELPTDFSEKSEEILDKLGPDNAYRFDYWLAAQPEELPSTFFEYTTCGSGTNGCDVMAFYNHSFDWYNSALIVHAFRGDSTNQSLPQSFAPGSGFSDDLLNATSAVWGSPLDPDWVIVPNAEFAQAITFGKRLYANGGDVLTSTIKPAPEFGPTFWSVKGEVVRASEAAPQLPQHNASEFIVDNNALLAILEGLTQEGDPTQKLFDADDYTIRKAKENTWGWNLVPYQRIAIENRPESVEVLPLLFPNVTSWRNLKMTTSDGEVLACNSTTYDPLFELPNGMQFDLRTRLTVSYDHVLDIVDETNNPGDMKFAQCVNALLQRFNASYDFSCDDIANDGSFSVEFVMYPDGVYPEECSD